MITDLAEQGAPDEVIRDVAGHVSKQMLKHYSHVRMQAKRKAMELLVEPAAVQANVPEKTQNCDGVVQESSQVTVLN
jgi:predicted Zn-ribbon and HTH transcriptional regulator